MTAHQQTVQSPFNYTGGKYKLLPQILPLFPHDADDFVDLFCGGGNVGINVVCDSVLFNDSDAYVCNILRTFKDLDEEHVLKTIDEIIDKYGLSNSCKFGYGHYGCDSSSGLASFNNEKYLRLRDDYNAGHIKDYNPYIVLFVLIIYSFNNQIRFNGKGEFNLPVGKRDFNGKMRQKLTLFMERLQNGNFSIQNTDFELLSADSWNESTFVYADPPYLITCASYNERGGWGESEERRLLSYLDALSARRIRFALSNVVRSKGRENKILLDWVEEHKDKYRLINLNFDYNNSNYHKKICTCKAEEVLILNY